MSDENKPKDEEKKIITLERSKGKAKPDQPEDTDEEGEFVRNFVIGISQNGGYTLEVEYNTGDSDLFIYANKDELLDILRSALK